MSVPPPISILGWKTKLNEKRKITRFRFLVKFNELYLYLDARHTAPDSRLSQILYDIEITELPNMCSPADIDLYINSMKGRHSIILHDIHRTTEDNIMMYRVYNDIQNAILNRISGFEGQTSMELYRRYTKEYIDPIPHINTGLYGEDIDRTDTDTILDASMCSGDTRADILAKASYDVNRLLGLLKFIDTAKDEDENALCNLISDNELLMYQDTVQFRKALKCYPERHDELFAIRRNMWENSQYYRTISEGFGG